MRIWKKAVSMLLALVFLLTSAVGAGPLPFLAPASAAAAEVDTITIASGEMTVYLDEAFPSVVEYHLGDNVFYGRGQSEADNRIVQIGVVTDYSHTSSQGGAAPTNTGMKQQRPHHDRLHARCGAEEPAGGLRHLSAHLL